MDYESRLLEFLENSFLSTLLACDSVTDISWNGESIFYLDNRYGRRKSDLEVTNEMVGDFLRQIANFSEKQFSYMEPVLDVSFGRYRMNASFLSVTRVNNRKAYSFSLRIASAGSAVEKADDFFPSNTKDLLLTALNNGDSIVIGGETGCGKTELQKFLLLHLPDYTRIVVIDNVQELELSRGNGNLDMTSWLVDEHNPRCTFSALIRNSLRNNPDYLLVAESRGEEMVDALNAVMSGHPLITTLHAKDISAIPHRMARMAMQAGRNLVYEELLADIYHHFSVVVYLKRSVREDGTIFRRISEFGYLNEGSRTIDYVYKEDNRS
ncbi:MAG: Flp pilus assembly complex ATPase component TadA [Bacilli bacterium]|nr:Flp pilus assembly complex ATPase component TadA [Bacilli bacterium]